MELTGLYEFPDTSINVTGITFRVHEDIRQRSIGEMRSEPPLKIEGNGHSYDITYHALHPAFVEFADSAHDYILLELASLFSRREGSTDWPASRIFQELKNRYQIGRKLDIQSLGREATDILCDLKDHLIRCGISKSISELNEDLIDEVESDMLDMTGSIEELPELLQSGGWVKHLSDRSLIALIEEDPLRIMEGAFFRTSYSAIRNEEKKKETFERLLSSIRDLIMIKKGSERSNAPDKQLLLRANASISYLKEQLD